MVRDTFERNPGLCELFKRKILDRAESVGLKADLIDFDSQIDMKGTFQENLRSFYREYSQLAVNSDYLRLKSSRPLSGAALEQSWLSYERSNAQELTEEPMGADAIIPKLTVTYTIGRESAIASSEAPNGPEMAPARALLSQVEPAQGQLTHSELMKLLLDRVTAMAGEDVAKTILHQVGRDLGRTAFDHARRQYPTNNLAAGLDHALRSRALGHVVELEEVDHASNVTYTCRIADCSFCKKRVEGNPSCSIMRGIVSRWLESHLQKKTEHIEGGCVTANPHICLFRLTFRK